MIKLSKKRRFKQKQAIQNDRVLYINEDSITETLDTALEKSVELGRNLTDEEFKEIFEKKTKMKVVNRIR